MCLAEPVRGLPAEPMNLSGFLWVHGCKSTLAFAAPFHRRPPSLALALG
jgi:hypothetical protein